MAPPMVVTGADAREGRDILVDAVTEVDAAATA
jgi:hypothetical protein